MRKVAASTAGKLALGTYLAWTAGTWLFEGRIQTLMRPDAVADRLVYALVVNLLLGIGGSLFVLGRLVRSQRSLEPARCGFGSPVRTVLATVVGLALGLAFYVAQGAPSTNAVVVTNAFAQVFVVSVAEVLVCWALVGVVLEAESDSPNRLAPNIVAAVSAAVLFGLYHFAHSPPFDTWPMVGFLTVVGLFTGAFFFISRDVLGTAVFHNFLGTFGVTQALVEGGATGSMETVQVPLVGTALVTLLLLLAGYVWVKRPG
jgi:hypothetical protein